MANRQRGSPGIVRRARRAEHHDLGVNLGRCFQERILLVVALRPGHEAKT